jgi:hypothetical protein
MRAPASAAASRADASLRVAACATTLGEHRVVVHPDDRPDLHPAVHPHSLAGRHREGDERAGRRQEAAGRVLGVQPRLDGVTGEARRRDLGRQRLALRDEQLQTHEVQAGHELGHRVLDLQAGVHLEERRGAVGREHELDGSGPRVGHRPRGGDGGLAQPGAQGLVDRRRGGLLEHLLVAPLHRAVALEQRHDLPVQVRHHLHLDVARPLDVALEEDRPVPERLLRLAPGAVDSGVQRLLGSDDPHAPPATAGTGLHQHRVADLARGRREPGRGQPGDVDAWQHRHAGCGHELLRGELRAHRRDRLGRRTDPGQADVQDGLGERCVLGQEPVAGVHRVGAGALRRVDQTVAAQVGVARCAARQVHRDVGLGDERCVRVGVGEDGDAADAHGATGTEDAAGDLAPVGDQQALHAPHIRNTPKPRAPRTSTFATTDRHRPSTVRVSRGSRMPSS